jgi:hypothetical protein
MANKTDDCNLDSSDWLSMVFAVSGSFEQLLHVAPQRFLPNAFERTP